MWFADVICDFDWFIACKGDLGPIRARVKSRVSKPRELDVEFLLYGGDLAVRHLRVLIHADEKDVVDECLNHHVLLWTHSLETSSAIGSGQPCSVATFPGTTAFAVITGEGNESAKAVTMDLDASPPQPADYNAIATGIANWKLESKTHLFYLIRFLNPSLPPDARWLNGYRLAEWHFMQGKDGLAGNVSWQATRKRCQEPFFHPSPCDIASSRLIVCA